MSYVIGIIQQTNSLQKNIVPLYDEMGGKTIFFVQLGLKYPRNKWN